MQTATISGNVCSRLSASICDEWIHSNHYACYQIMYTNLIILLDERRKHERSSSFSWRSRSVPFLYEHSLALSPLRRSETVPSKISVTLLNHWKIYVWLVVHAPVSTHAQHCHSVVHKQYFPSSARIFTLRSYFFFFQYLLYFKHKRICRKNCFLHECIDSSNMCSELNTVHTTEYQMKIQSTNELKQSVICDHH